LPELKKLLDGLRVRSLSKYYINGKYSEKVSYELSKVNLAEQPTFYRFIFKSPSWILKIYLNIRRSGSFVKNHLSKS
jgi:hypothetical protein